MNLSPHPSKHPIKVGINSSLPGATYQGIHGKDLYEMIKDYVDNNNVDIVELMKENNIQKLLKYYEP